MSGGQAARPSYMASRRISLNPFFLSSWKEAHDGCRSRSWLAAWPPSSTPELSKASCSAGAQESRSVCGAREVVKCRLAEGRTWRAAAA